MIKLQRSGGHTRPFFNILAAALLLVAPLAQAQGEHTGISRLPLVKGTLVSPVDQEAFGLLTLVTPSGVCSASMLNRYWAITASHCVFDAKGVIYAASQITLSSAWPGRPLSGPALRVKTYGSAGSDPIDIALIQTSGVFSRLNFPDRKLYDKPATPTMQVKAFGRGISELAYQAGPTAVPVKRDGKFRSATFELSAADTHQFTFDNSHGAITAGGDSGGPSFLAVWDKPDSPTRKLEWRLLGVHSSCSTQCLSGQSCAAPNPWTWVAEVPSCSDAAVWSVRDSIRTTIEDSPPDTSWVGTFPPARPGVAPVFIYAVNPDGRLTWLRHDGAQNGDGLATAGAWVGPSEVGHGWGDVEAVVGGGGDAIYFVGRDGLLNWYRHKGFNTGAGTNDPSAWTARKPVGRGWGRLQHVFSGGNGILYSIADDGILRWYKHNGISSGDGLDTPGAWEPRKDVGRGWGGLVHVFSGGDGVIYTITTDGILHWLKHKGYRTGAGLETAGSWEGPLDVGRGWTGLKHVFSGSNGIIYTVADDGVLRWRRHNGYQTGAGLTTPGAWTATKDVGRGWGDAMHVFTLMPGDPAPVR